MPYEGCKHKLIFWYITNTRIATPSRYRAGFNGYFETRRHQTSRANIEKTLPLFSPLSLIIQTLPYEKLTNTNSGAMVRGDFASGTQLRATT